MIGVFNVLGNKGGIAIRLTIFDSNCCFVGSHFHAHANAVTVRNLDFSKIICGAIFTPSVATAQGKEIAKENRGSSHRITSDVKGANTISSFNSNSVEDKSNVMVEDSVRNALLLEGTSSANNNNDIPCEHSSPSDYWKQHFQKYLRSHKDRNVTILDHEFVFWLGDLNYRISWNGNDFAEINRKNYSYKTTDFDGDFVDGMEANDINIDHTQAVDISAKYSTLQAISACSAGRFQSLVEFDQLNIERAKNTVFQGFQEGPLHFPPTYKYQPGTDLYESRQDKKLRAPAWCDRVLWRVAPEEQAAAVELLHYGRAEVNCSDHKPVRAFFQCNVREVDVGKMRELYEALLLSVDDWINATKPKLELDLQTLNFGSLHCYVRIEIL